MSLRQHITRRRLIAGSAATVTAGCLDACVLEPRWLDETRHRHPVEGLPLALEGFTLMQITDAHLTGLGRVETGILEAVRNQAPQLVVLTGDLIDDIERGDILADLCAEISRTAATVIATLGNWEHWGRIDRATLRRLYGRSNTSLLVDSWARVDGIAVYASDDSTAGSPSAIAPGDTEQPRVLLTHSPAFVDRDHGEARFELCLAGHTHGGQITAAGLAPFTPPGSGPYVAGWYETALGPLYVSRGTGTSIVPARLTCRPELPLVELVRG